MKFLCCRLVLSTTKVERMVKRRQEGKGRCCWQKCEVLCVRQNEPVDDDSSMMIMTTAATVSRLMAFNADLNLTFGKCKKKGKRAVYGVPKMMVMMVRMLMMMMIPAKK